MAVYGVERWRQQRMRTHSRVDYAHDWRTACRGLHTSAALYSLISTARANTLEPYAYLKNLFETLPHARTVDDFEALLTFN